MQKNKIDQMYPPTQSPDPRNRTPSAGPPFQQQPPVADPYQPVHHRPQSTYDHPQELGTSVYDSPVDRPAAQQLPYPPGGQIPPIVQQRFPQQPQPQQQEYSPSAYSPDDVAQAPYPSGPVGHQPPPMHQPPPVPNTSAKPTPYPALNAGTSSGEYEAYNPSASNPALFYR